MSNSHSSDLVDGKWLTVPSIAAAMASGRDAVSSIMSQTGHSQSLSFASGNLTGRSHTPMLGGSQYSASRPAAAGASQGAHARLQGHGVAGSGDFSPEVCAVKRGGMRRWAGPSRGYLLAIQSIGTDSPFLHLFLI